MKHPPADVCLILEGTYPYVSGGVSTWTHRLIEAQKHLTFHLFCILPPGKKRKKQYELPSNVVGIDHLVLQDIPMEKRALPKQKLLEIFEEMEGSLVALQHKPEKAVFERLLKIFKTNEETLGFNSLLNSQGTWNMLLRMYRQSMGRSSFLNFFWSWRSLYGGLFSILKAKIPEASIYHALCTGYAGIFLARAHIETGKPTLITEHGIYTNERRIEIIAAQWLADQKSMRLNIHKKIYERDIKDFWIDMFSGYSKLSYQISQNIITLHKGNIPFQLEDGADPKKILTIPNGVDVNHFGSLPRKSGHPKTIGFIGRIVPIKDVKTFIRAAALIQETIKDLRVLILGPYDEDPEYYQECQELVEKLNIQEVIQFKGKVNVDQYLPEIDLLIMTSISESQPLVLLEAGSASIPCIATDVGACREMILGPDPKNPDPGGAIAELANPKSVATAALRLLENEELYEKCSETLKRRCFEKYRKDVQDETYKNLYAEYLEWQELALS